MDRGKPMEITLLTQESCAFCDQAKEVLRRLSAEYEISIRELDLASPSGEALAESGGVMFPPGIFIGGESFSYGRPSERRLRREFDRRLGSTGKRR